MGAIKMRDFIFIVLLTPSICFAEWDGGKSIYTTEFNFSGSTHQTPDNCPECRQVFGKVEIPKGRPYKFKSDCNTCEGVGGSSLRSCTAMNCPKPEIKTYCDRNDKTGELENCNSSEIEFEFIPSGHTSLMKSNPLYFNLR